MRAGEVPFEATLLKETNLKLTKGKKENNKNKSKREKRRKEIENRT